MKLDMFIISCFTFIIGILLFFGAWGARLQLIIDTESLTILNFLGFFIMLISGVIITIDLGLEILLKKSEG